MTFKQRCEVFGVYRAAEDLYSRDVRLKDALMILRFARIGRVEHRLGVWRPA